jgi:hypothetical protein
MKIRLTNEQIRQALEIPSPVFPKYVKPIINMVNQNAQGTRPRVVGQLTELIQEFSGETLEKWEQWYLERYPNAINAAKEKIILMLENFKDAMRKIDEETVYEWARDLVIVQTFIGLQFQEAILKKGADIKGGDYKMSEKTGESQGIDGYVGDIPVSIKPDTYKLKKSLREEIAAKIIYYKKIKNGIEVDYGELFV